jgi:hypothetical protein
MTVQELRDILKDYPDELYVVVNIPHPTVALRDVEAKVKAPLLVCGELPGYVHVEIDGSIPRWRRKALAAQR